MTANQLLMIYFWIFTLAIVFGGIGTVTFRSLYHSALSLITALAGVAGYFLILNAEFLAAAQVIIYIGAIMVLVISAILVAQNVMGQEITQTNKLVVPALIGSAGLFAVMVLAVAGTGFIFEPGPQGLESNVKQIGWSLMATYVLPFEIASVLLFMALLGAIVLARKDD
jgi:NADH:ubiquinone oxidoreductase subunit 6 (subunit J)